MWKYGFFLTVVTSVWATSEGPWGVAAIPTRGKPEYSQRHSFAQAELKCFHPINWKSIARTLKTESGVKDAAACQRLCAKEDQCTHFNYHTDSHNCELKIKNGSDVVEAANVITGPKTCSSSCFTLGVGHTAKEMARSERKYSPFDCQSWCRDTNGCFYFTFNLDSSTCFLKGADAPGTEREYPGDMVGPKEFCSGGDEDVETEEESESGTGSDGAGSGAGSEGEEELKCFHPINWKSIARTLKTESGVKDAAACQRLCAKEDQCTHFNYHTDSHNCELKIKNGSDVVEAANVITGPKTCSSSCFTLGVGHTAKEMARSERKYSPFDCQSWCRDTNGCFYFTFNLDSSTCFLKGADAPGTEREYPGDMVGPKEFCSGGGEDVETEEESESGTGSDGAGSGAGSEGEEELKCFHPINWKSIARTLKTESGVKDAAACQRLCAKEDQCTHFNYHTDSHNCELKIKNGSDVVEAANVITGPKTCSSSCFTLGVGHTANNMATPGKMYSPFDCQSWCRDTNGCFYFTFNRNSSTCFLKGADAPGTEREYPGDMVGPKEFCSGGGEDVETEEESESGTGSDGAGSGAGSEGEEELKCFHPINWKSIARTLKTESGVKDAAACQRLCAKEDQCTHFNYHTDSHNCELKIKNGSDVVEAANVITGPKTCNSSCFTLGVGHTANNMARSEKKYSPFDCQSWCRDTNGCFYFTFNRNSSTCFLKGADAPGTEREYPGDMVGPKEFCSGGGEDVETEEESESGTGSDGAESGAGSEVESQPEALPGGQERPEEQPPIPGPSPDGDNGKEELVPPVPELEEGSGTAGTEADTPGHILPSRYPAPIPDTGLSSNLVCIHPRHKTTTAEIHKSLPGLPTPEDCHLACWHEGECTHFTYNLTTGRCDLRTNDSSHVTEEVDHITGPKSCNSSCFTVGKGHSAHNVAPITDKYSAFDCQSWCRQNNNCMYFTYNTVTKKCYLKGNDAPNTLSPSPDDVVGPRDFCPS